MSAPRQCCLSPIAGAVILTLLMTLTALAPLLPLHPPAEQSGPPFAPPGPEHLLGTNDVGQDLLSELVVGARASLGICLSVGLIATLLGGGLGILAGYFRGLWELSVMRSADVFLALPMLPLAIVVAAFVGPGLAGLVLLLSAMLWAQPARLLRARTLALASAPHVESARCLGAGNSRIIKRHLLPGLTPFLRLEWTRVSGVALLLESSLSFLGLGDPTRKSWGTTLYDAASRGALLSDAWLWWVLPPGLLISLAAIALALLGLRFGDENLPTQARKPLRQARPSEPTAKNRPAAGADPPPTSALLYAEGLRIHYLELEVLRGLEVALHPGETLGITGESGCGKSTLALTLTGLLRGDAKVRCGRMAFEGEWLAPPWPAQMQALRGRRIALLPQTTGGSALNPLKRVDWLVAEAVRVHHGLDWRTARLRAGELLEQLGFPPERRHAWPQDLSGGMQKRVSLAIALAGTPDVLIADEPTAGLDPLAQRQVLDLIDGLRAQMGLTLLLITHDLGVLASRCSRLMVLYAGSIVEEGPAGAILRHPRHPYTRALLGASLSATAEHTDLSLRLLPGETADTSWPPAGCSLHPRCPLCVPRCRHEMPAQRQLDHGARRVACHQCELPGEEGSWQ